MSVVYTELPPSPALSGLVRCYWAIEGRVAPGEVIDNRVLPDGCMDVMFDFGDEPAGAVSVDEPGYAVGAMVEAVVVGLRGRVDLVGVRFQPGAAGTWLGIPALELTSRFVELSAVRREAAGLAERLQISGDTVASSFARGLPAGAAKVARDRLHMRSAHFEAVLGATRRTSPDALAAHAVRLIEASHGGIAVRELERRLDVSPRTLTRRFSDAVGVTPKMACRVARLQHAASLIRRDPSVSLARLAVRAGFHDQAHLTRDFSELARITPAAFVREARGGFVQDGTLVEA